MLLKSEDQGGERSGFPVPPDHLRTYLGFAKTPEIFLNTGREHVDIMKSILGKSGFSLESATRILDYGCGAGRMIRWLNDYAERCEVWGVDIQAELIIWCQQHLSPPFKFATVTTGPHLPFEDRSFDLIISGSVFSHIDDLADAWLLELKRILQPGGMLYITVDDKYTIQTIINSDWGREFPEFLPLYDEKQKLGQIDFNMLCINRGYGATVFYDIDYLKRHWGRFLDIISVTQDAWGPQTAILLKK